MKTLIIKYTFDDTFSKSDDEELDALEDVFESLEALCGCAPDGEGCSLVAGSSRWVVHGEDEYVDDCVAKLDDIED